VIQETLAFAQQRPLVTGLIVVGTGALIYVAATGGGSDGEEVLTAGAQNAAALYTRPSDAEIAAASEIATSQLAFQRASEDSQIAAVLGSKSLDYEYDLERMRVANAGTVIATEGSLEAQRIANQTFANDNAFRLGLRDNDLAMTTANNEYGLGLAKISSQYNSDLDTLRYTTALGALQSTNAYNLGVTQSYNDAKVSNYAADSAIALTRIQADTQTYQSQLDYQSQVAAADAQVRAAKASKKKGFSFGFGPFSIGGSW
jgi:hypothetical protein